MVKKEKSLFYCCLHSNLHAVILQQNTSLQLLREKESVTQELEIRQSSAACSTTSSLDVVSNKVRLLEKKKKIQTMMFFGFFHSLWEYKPQHGVVEVGGCPGCGNLWGAWECWEVMFG